jgi:hypothetical protein
MVSRMFSIILKNQNKSGIDSLILYLSREEDTVLCRPPLG